MTTRNFGKKEEQRKNQIIQAAFDVISSKGYNNFTIEDIANQAGLSKGGVLHYFKAKEDILIFLLERIYMVIEETIIKRSGKYRTPEKKMKAIIIAFIITAKRYPAMYTVMVDFWAQIPINERIKNINTKIFMIICSEVKKIVDLGIERKEFNDIDSNNASYLIVSMILNVAIQWTFNNTLYNIDHMTKTCMSMVMAYLKKRPMLSQAGQ